MADSSKDKDVLCQNERTEEAKEEEQKKEIAEDKPLTAAEFRLYNRMAEHMDLFHNHFRQTWTTIHNAVQNNRRPPSTSLKQFLNLCSQFTSSLSLHHDVEENHIFPILAKKMPEFKNTALLLEQHKKIHEGMDGFEAYVEEVKRGDRELVLKELGERMGWGDVLWAHLDEEVKTLGAENMRRYWSIADMKTLPK